MPSRTIEDVLKKYTSDLMAIPGVIGTGQGLCDGEPCIKVFLIKNTRESGDKIPKELEGFKVEVEETGKFLAYQESQAEDCKKTKFTWLLLMKTIALTQDFR